MFLKRNNKINIGDKVLVYMEGEIKHLEVIAIPEIKSFFSRLFTNGYPELVTVKFPDGKKMDCQYRKLAY